VRGRGAGWRAAIPDCHYIQAQLRGRNAGQTGKKKLAKAGFDPEKLWNIWCSARRRSQVSSNTMREMVKRAEALIRLNPHETTGIQRLNFIKLLEKSNVRSLRWGLIIREWHTKFAERFNAIEMFPVLRAAGAAARPVHQRASTGFHIRRLVRHVELDLIEEIAASPCLGSAPPAAAARSRPNGIKILDITRTLRAIGPEDRFPQSVLVHPGLPGRDRRPRLLAPHRQGRTTMPIS